MDNKELYNYWLEVEKHLGIYSSESHSLYERIIFPYGETHRYHHNLDHVKDIVKKIDQINLDTESRITLIICAFFHDLEYEIGSNENEQKSADFLIEYYCGRNVISPIIGSCYNIILDTKNHAPKDQLSKLFSDLDMSVLGSSISVYKKYSENIRKEHSKTPYWLYKLGRRNFLKRTLDEECIFHTEFFKTKYEEQAIVNLKNELRTL